MSLRVVVLGNYGPDAQQSMRRFADWLVEAARASGAEVELRVPPAIAGRGAAEGSARHKWGGWLDKLVVFPLLLLLRRPLDAASDRLRARRTVHHVADHSNAPWLAVLPADRSVITCHDVLAIAGALGDADAHCPASRTGVWLQRWILRHLGRARRVVCVSAATLAGLERLAPASAVGPVTRVVVPNALNAPFAPPEPAAAGELLAARGLPRLAEAPYVLHVGSALERKNRQLVVRLLAAGWDGDAVLAGRPIEPALRALADELDVADRLHELVDPTHDELVAAYGLAHALVFPSYAEGFGWPVAEAQACGTPVVASSRPPMPEVGGPDARYADPDDVAGFAAHLQALREPGARAAQVAAGLANVRRFADADVRAAYRDVHRAAAAGREGAA